MKYFGDIIVSLVPMLFVATVFTCCGATQKVSEPIVVEKTIMVPVKEKCLEMGAPKFVPIPSPTACMPGKICYDIVDAANLVDDIERALEWIRQALILCSTK